jgi:hypothetical protein
MSANQIQTGTVTQVEAPQAELHEVVARLAQQYRLSGTAAECREFFENSDRYRSLIGCLEQNKPGAQFWSAADGGAKAIARIAVAGFRAGETQAARIVHLV